MLLGVCYAFNADGKLVAKAAGMYSGLMLNLDAAVYSYYIGPGAVASGFTVSILYSTI